MTSRPMTHVMVAGTSEPQDFQILNEGIAFSGTGFDIDIEWRASPVAEDGDLPVAEWLSQAAGTVRVTGAEAMTIGAHRFRWTLTETIGGSDVGYVPNLALESNTWRVVGV